MHRCRAAVTGLGLIALAGVPMLVGACGNSSEIDVSTPHVVAKSKEEIGRYILQIAGCHDCHTPGVLQGQEPKSIPEEKWFTGGRTPDGAPLGFVGPWGTTYGQNLRLKVAPYTEQMFVAAMRKRNDRPPMPWASLHAMSDEDLGAVLVYLKSIGPAGTPMPEPLPPGAAPKQPFLMMVPDMPPPAQPK